jgi:hypothetical protein
MKTTEMTVADFCDIHGACPDSRKWALATGCATMSELWQRDDMRHDFRVWTATRRGVLDQKTLRLFACWSVRQEWHLLTDDRSKKAVEVAELYAIGKATSEELYYVRCEALDAARAVRYALDAAFAAYSAATTDAVDAASEAALYAARSVWSTMDAAKAAQAGWIIANAKPNFETAQ